MTCCGKPLRKGGEVLGARERCKVDCRRYAPIVKRFHLTKRPDRAVEGTREPRDITAEYRDAGNGFPELAPRAQRRDHLLTWPHRYLQGERCRARSGRRSA